MVQLKDSAAASGTPRLIPFSGAFYHEYWDTDSYIDVPNDGFTIPSDGAYDVGFQVQVDGSSASAVSFVTVYADLMPNTAAQWEPQVAWQIPTKATSWQVLGQAVVPMMITSGGLIQFSWNSDATAGTVSVIGGFWVRRIGDYVAPS